MSDLEPKFSPTSEIASYNSHVTIHFINDGPTMAAYDQQ